MELSILTPVAQAMLRTAGTCIAGDRLSRPASLRGVRSPIRQLHWIRAVLRNRCHTRQDVMDACASVSRPAMDEDPDGARWIAWRTACAISTMYEMTE